MKIFVQEKVDDIQEQITDMHYGEKYKQILAQYAILMKNKARGKLVEWAVSFHHNRSRFEETLSRQCHQLPEKNLQAEMC